MSTLTMDNSYNINCGYDKLYISCTYDVTYFASFQDNLLTHMNIRSFDRNSDELFIAVNNWLKIKATIIFSETWFKHDSLEKIAGPNSYHYVEVS